MGNLGGYQTITTLVKALGGPGKATVVGVVVVGTAGYGAIRLAEAGGKRLVVASKRALTDRRARSQLIGKSFTVSAQGTDDRGLEFKAGSRYIVLEHDDDAVLVELVGDQDNPHVVSASFLALVSDFPSPDLDEVD